MTTAIPQNNSRARVLMLVAGLLAIAALAALLFLLGQEEVRTARTDGPLRLEPVAIIAGPGRGESPTFSKPLGVAFGPEGEIYVADSGNDRICVFDADGDAVSEWGGLGVAKPLPGYRMTWRPGLLNYPTDVEVDATGRVYVADFHNDRISVFTREGEHLSSFPEADKPVGRGGSGKDGTGIAVTSVAASGGRVYATDAFQVFAFSADGTLLGQFGMPGGAADLDHPSGIAVSGDGTLVVSDSNHVRVASFSADGQPLWATNEAGAAVETTGGARALALPRGLTTLPDGRVLVADAVGQGLSLLDETGRVVDTLGNRGLGPGEFNFPTDVDVFGDLVIVADKENDRVQVLRLVGEGAPAADTLVVSR